MLKTTKLMLGGLVLQAVPALAQNAAKPNIVLIMTDQQSYNMISALAADPYVSTPNLDRLVSRGISFTNTYCANPVSVPSRFSLFTGMYGGEFDIRENRCEDASERKVLPVLKNSGMGNVFARAGYETVYAGKVHLPFAKGKNKFTDPVNYGFSSYLTQDEREGLAATASDFIQNRKSDKPLLLVVSFLNPHDICLESSTNVSSQLKDDERKPEIAATIREMRAKADGYSTGEFYSKIAPRLPANFAKTVDFPKFKPKAFDEFPVNYWRKYRWIYSQLVELADREIGKVLDAVDASGLKDNTLIVFTSDHGEMQGAHHATVKNLPYDECQHVPFIIAGRGIVAGQRDNSLVCNGTDLIPTLCGLAGVSVPEGLPGISLAQRAEGKGEAPQRKHLYLEGDGFSQIIENPDYKYTRFDIQGANEMLIDKRNDPGELRNVAGKNTDYEKKTAELAAVLKKYLNKNVKTK